MIDLGSFSLVLAVFFSLYGTLAGAVAGRRDDYRWLRSAARATHAVLVLSLCSILLLGAAFVRHDYRYAYVFSHSNNEMSPMYLVSAIWGGMDGSMLLWAVMMALYSSAVVWWTAGAPRRLFAWVISVLNLATGFFLIVVAFVTNPFRLLPELHVDGSGLNPLLQNPSMLLHPPCLYAGFTGFVVPFAFAVGALLSGIQGWTPLTRRWTLIAWAFLTTGIILGGNWAYIELGWGGFWAWDPVENASFLPWLSGTAYLHSVMVEERRGLLKVWNICLAILSYLLSVFGTFLTRSGVVQSVHAFAESDIGEVFLAYIGIVTLVSAALIVYRWKGLRPEGRIESFFSREAIFLFNNLLLLAICFATFWGVMFPVFSEALTGTKNVVGPPFYNAVNGPLFLTLIFFMGLGPLVAWRRSSPRVVIKLVLYPLLAGSLVTVLFFLLDPEQIIPAVSFGLVTFIVGAISGEFRRAIRVRRELGVQSGIVNLVRSKPRRYGGLIVHLGVAVMALAITASSVYKIERDFSLKKGERFEVGRFVLVLEELTEGAERNYTWLRSKVQVLDRRSGEKLGVLVPERRFYPRNEEVTSEVDIRVTPREDLYLALAGIGELEKKASVADAKAVFKVFVNPLQIWLWFGGLVVLFGSVVVLRPRMRGSERVVLGGFEAPEAPR